MKSVMSHQFSRVPQIAIPRSSFDRSHGYKSTIDFDYLYPVYVDEYLPGDTANLNMSMFARLATPIHPLMDNMYIDTFFFSVPYRLVWDNWEKFNGEQDNPTDSVDYLIPTSTSPAGQGYEYGSLSDYMGIPPGVPNLEHSSLWHRAYNLIWNQWFRDENLQDEAAFNKNDGPDNPVLFTLKKRGKRHDYFTSCLPFAQKDFGQPVLLPLGDRADITTDAITGSDLGINSSVQDVPVNMISGTTYVQVSANQTTPQQVMYADLNTATAATINQLRTAFQIQRMMERDARGGTRYTEIVRSHFGVTSPDARLQRSEYLGGGSSAVGITPVPQTTPAIPGGPGEETPQGNLAGYGTAVVNSNGFTKSFTEHTLVIGMVCARADLTYQQGLPRMFSRSTRYDHFFPSLAHLGEQAVLQKEIFATGDPEQDEIVFGYNERFAELRYKPSLITGQFRSSSPTPLDAWHLCQDFANAPTLSEQFIEQNTPIDRVVAVPSEPDLIFDAYIKLKHARPMPTYGTPGLIDHF